MARGYKLLTTVLVVCLSWLPASQSWGVILLRPDLEIEGFVQAQNILRTPMFQDAKFILQRNTAQIEAKYHFLQEGRAFGLLDTGPLEDASLTAGGRAGKHGRAGRRELNIRETRKRAARRTCRPGLQEDPNVSARQ